MVDLMKTKVEWNNGIAVGVIAWLVAFGITFGMVCFYANLPAVTDVSLAISFRPWWQFSNWASCAILTSPVYLIVMARKFASNL